MKSNLAVLFDEKKSKISQIFRPSVLYRDAETTAGRANKKYARSKTLR